MMTDEREHGTPAPEAAPVEQEASGGFFASMLDIFIDPMKVFRRIAAGMSWWMPFVAVSVIGIIIAIVNAPLTNRIIEMRYATMEGEELERIKSAMSTWKYVGYVAVPIIVLISNVIIAGIVHLVNSVISMRANFKKTLSLAMFCSFIGVLSQIIGSIIIWTRGIESIESPTDLRVSFGLAALFPDLEGFWYRFSESLSLFQIWYYILFVFGIAVIMSIERKKAVVAGIAVWLVSFLMMFLQGLAGGGM